jgi:hypothetical protein
MVLLAVLVLSRTLASETKVLVDDELAANGVTGGAEGEADDSGCVSRVSLRPLGGLNDSEPSGGLLLRSHWEHEQS